MRFHFPPWEARKNTINAWEEIACHFTTLIMPLPTVLIRPVLLHNKFHLTEGCVSTLNGAICRATDTMQKLRLKLNPVATIIITSQS